MVSTTRIDKQISSLINKYNVKIDLDIFKNRVKKLNNYVAYTINMYHNATANGKKISSKQIGKQWKLVKDEEKLLYSKIAKRYNKKKTKKKKTKVKKNKKKQKTEDFMFSYDIPKTTNELKEIIVDGVTYVIDCFRNIIDMNLGQEVGFINNKGKPVIYKSILDQKKK